MPATMEVQLREGALQRLMARRNLTVGDVAERADVTPAAVSWWRQGRRHPSPHTRARLLAALHADFGDLFVIRRGRSGTRAG